jgi:hypothetical protein
LPARAADHDEAAEPDSTDLELVNGIDMFEPAA